MRVLLRVLTVVGVLAIGGVAVVISVALRSEPPKKPASAPEVLVETVRLERVNAEFTVHSQGTVRPETETVLSSEVAGQIVEVSPAFTAGGVFAAGDTLMRIDPTNYEVALAQAEALLEQRRIEFEGAKKLRNQGFRAESEYASAKAALATAEAELVRAQRNLERTEIRLPYAGIVRARDANLGQYVNIGTRLGVTFDTAQAQVRLPLTNRDLAFVDLPKPGTEDLEGPLVRLIADIAGREVVYRARIVRTEGVIDESSRVTHVVALLADPYGFDSGLTPLPVGSFVAAEIDGISAVDILRVPRYALRGSNQLMFRDEESRLRIRSVDIVRADSDWAYLAAGAEPGDEVILTALESPVNGMRVRTPDDAPDASIADTVDP